MRKEKKPKIVKRYMNKEKSIKKDVIKEKIRVMRKNTNAADIFDVGGIFKLQNSKTFLSFSTCSSENLNLTKL